jgi:IS30 family transposase
MKRHTLTAADGEAVWSRWVQGDTQAAIAEALGCTYPTVSRLLHRTGGFRPRVRRRAARVLSSGERGEISRGLAAGRALRAVAAQLGRAPSTISREVGRHGGRAAYRAGRADSAAWAAARRPKLCRLAQSPRLRQAVEQGLARRWSPEQIAGWLRRTYADPAMHLSHEAIYRTLYVQPRGGLKREFQQYLRRRHTMRRPRVVPTVTSGPLADGVSIAERPAEVADRAVPGHWEGDLLSGTVDSHIATLVERRSRYVLLAKLPSKDAPTVARTLARHVRTLPRVLRRSLTWDRGRELAAHRHFTVATDVQVYFCDPHSPWQRGSNENTNGLLRQYLPRGMDFSQVPQARLNHIANELNQRPRKTLGFQTPADILNQIVASTG